MTDTEAQKNRRKNSEFLYTQDRYERRGDDYLIISATTAELRKIFNQIRYLSYCEEHPEFEQNHNIDKTESDEHEGHSIYFLLMYKPLQMFVGGTRVILPIPDDEWCGLPAVQYNNSPFQENFPHKLTKMAEVSRFIILKNRMKIVRGSQTDVVDMSFFAEPFRHLVGCVFKVCKEYSLDGFIAILEEFLFKRSNKLFGVGLTKHGDPIEHHGIRQGGYLLIDDLLEKLKQIEPKNYHLLMDYMSRDDPV